MFSFFFSKHRWRVGIMTEMAPVGYVGVSPKCVLGLNKVCIITSIKNYVIKLCYTLLYFLFHVDLILTLAESWRGDISTSSN